MSAARIVSIGTALPDEQIPQADIKEAVRHMFGAQVPHLDRLLTIFDHSGIETRHFCTPLEWFLVPHSVEEKQRLFVRHASALAERAAQDCLAKAGVRPEDIDHLLFVTTTGTATPSIDAHLCNRMSFRRNVKRSPLWGLGCAGGAAGLSRASEYARAFPDQLVLVIAVELCSLTFIRGDATKSNIVATSLFADGAAAALVTRRNGLAGSDYRTILEIAATQSTIWPNSLDVMGWDVTNEGLKVVFSKDIPTLVRREMRGVIDSLLAGQGIQSEAIGAYALHPGGMKVLRAYEEALALSPGMLEASERVLRTCGNMSSCTVLFVLEQLMRTGGSPSDQRPRYGVAGALGPGFSSEMLLLQLLENAEVSQ